MRLDIAGDGGNGEPKEVDGCNHRILKYPHVCFQRLNPTPTSVLTNDPPILRVPSQLFTTLYLSDFPAAEILNFVRILINP